MIEIVTNVTLKKDHTFILERQSDILSKNLSPTSFKFVRALYLFYIYFHTYVHTHFLVLGFVILKNLLFFFLQVCLKETDVLISILFACTQSGNYRSQNRGKLEIALLPDSKVSVFQISLIL